ncbi:MAG: hypothetical protein K9N11_07765 [Lentisphaeria bacterium]|nr:hypothetical protein [Candidatus Neomarinimicrobiota bacterium]MCF7842733.1 hypothetical protein [Lentisphaeria bacterium]
MEEIAKLILQYDAELRKGLKTGRTGLFRRADGGCYVRSQVPLGGKYQDETIMIFADEADLDLFYKSYLP